MVFFLLLIVGITCLLVFYSLCILPTAAPTNYKVVEIPGFLSKDECESLILYATRKGLEKSMTWDSEADGGERIEYKNRDSEQTWIPLGENIIVDRIKEYVSKITGLPLTYQEDMQIARYKPNGKFVAHHDACQKNSPSCKNMNHNLGQRIYTFLIYLNDDFIGGNTVFSNINQTIIPKQGQAVLFRNVDENDEIIEESLHEAQTVESGEKWIANVWVHSTEWK